MKDQGIALNFQRIQVTQFFQDQSISQWVLGIYGNKLIRKQLQLSSKKVRFSLGYIALKAWLRIIIAGWPFDELASWLLHTASDRRFTANSYFFHFFFFTWKDRNNAERSLSIIFTKHVLNPVGSIAVLGVLSTQQPQCLNITWWSLDIFAGIIHF